MTGRIFDIQYFCTHDGPGIRTVVFLQGCPLRCAWCHNPESRFGRPLLTFFAQRCIGCGDCLGVCPHEVHRIDESRHELSWARCQTCGACVQACPAQALVLTGRTVGVEEVLTEIERDRAFYQSSGGGVTISGGEPLAQADFTAALLHAARQAGLHTAVETSGIGRWESLAKLASLTDLFLYDLKETDEQRHREFTGVSFDGVVGNLRRLDERDARIILRLPIIPGYNDRADHLEAVSALVRSLRRPCPVEALPYHAMGRSKQERMGLSEALPTIAAPTAEQKVQWVHRLEAGGLTVLNRGELLGSGAAAGSDNSPPPQLPVSVGKDTWKSRAEHDQHD